jgi:hypothetical protein
MKGMNQYYILRNGVIYDKDLYDVIEGYSLACEVKNGLAKRYDKDVWTIRKLPENERIQC